MPRFKQYSVSAVLLLAAFALLLLTVISVPITRFSSLASANNTKFGVFGYCYNDGGCSGIHIGYDTDSILRGIPTSSLSRRRDVTSLESANVAVDLVRRQNNNPTAGGGGIVSNGNPDSFNLPAQARNGLANILIVHVVAAGLTLFLFILALIGHLPGPSKSAGFMLTVILISVPTLVLTLLAFLIDILIFVPNLDWGTWITLGATVLNGLAAILLCTARRRLKTRRAMRKNIAENDDLNAQNYYNSQHLQDPEPMPVSVAPVVMSETDKATLPRFTQYDYEHPDPVDTETVPLTRREPDDRSVRSETASLTSPPRYPPPAGGGGHVYSNVHEMQELQPISPPDRGAGYARARIPYGNPPRGHHVPSARNRPPRAISREPSSNSIRLDHEQMDLEPPLAHPREPISHGLERTGEDLNDGQDLWTESDGTNRAVPGQGNDWATSGRRDPAPARGGRGERKMRVVSGPRPMPNGPAASQERRQPVRSPSGNYYDDIPPQFDQGSNNTRYHDDEYLDVRPSHGQRRHTPQGSGSFDRPVYPQQPRSPDTLSNSSHFTSVSQRGINPAWRGDGQHPGAPHHQQQHSYSRGPRQDRLRGPPKPNFLADNPDFVLPSGGNRSRLPASRRNPNAMPGLTTTSLGAGQSPYAIAKGM